MASIGASPRAANGYAWACTRPAWSDGDQRTAPRPSQPPSPSESRQAAGLALECALLAGSVTRAQTVAAARASALLFRQRIRRASRLSEFYVRAAGCGRIAADGYRAWPGEPARAGAAGMPPRHGESPRNGTTTPCKPRRPCSGLGDASIVTLEVSHAWQVHFQLQQFPGAAGTVQCCLSQRSAQSSAARLCSRS